MKNSSLQDAATEMAEFVLDASVALAWFFQDAADAYADRVLESLAERTAVVPSIWPLEIANALVTGERRNRNLPEQSDTWLSNMKQLPIRVEAEVGLAEIPDLLAICRSWQLTSYDAAYLELARRLQLPLATLDQKLHQAASAAGLTLFPA